MIADARGAKALGRDVEVRDQRRFVEVERAVESSGNLRELEVPAGEASLPRAALKGSLLKRAGELGARKRQRIATQPAAIFERARVVPAGVGIQAPLAFNREVDGVRAGEAAELQFERKRGPWRDLLRVRLDSSELPLRAGRGIAIVDRAALELERAERPARRFGGRGRRARRRLRKELRPIADAVGADAQPRRRLRNGHGLEPVGHAQQPAPGKRCLDATDLEQGLIPEARRLGDRELADVETRRRKEADAQADRR